MFLYQMWQLMFYQNLFQETNTSNVFKNQGMCLIPKPGTLSQHQALITFHGEQHYLSLCGWCSCEWIHYTTRYSSFDFFPPTLSLPLQLTKTPSMAKYQSGSKIYKPHKIFNIHPSVQGSTKHYHFNGTSSQAPNEKPSGPSCER